jgi:integrase
VKKPWFRKASRTWYVELPGGRQIALGTDERYPKDKPPPRGRIKDPPEHIKKRYHEVCRSDRQVKDRTIGDVFDEYLASMDEYDKGTRKVSRLHLKWFREHVGDGLKVSELEPLHVTSHLRRHPNWAKTTRRVAIAKIKAALNYGVREGWIAKNPISSMKKPPSARREAIITPQERDMLEAAAVPEFRDFLVALRESGCRPGELAETTVDKLDLKAGTVKVKNKTAASTGSKWRTVYLSSKLIELLARLNRREGHLFLNCEGNPWRVETLTTRMRKLRKRLGLGDHCILYSYRHEFASGVRICSKINVPISCTISGAVLSCNSNRRGTCPS